MKLDPFPFGKTFSVSFVDDTDNTTLDRLRPVYRLLSAAGVRATKTVWALSAVAPSGCDTIVDNWTPTLVDPQYAEYCQELQAAGHEIALHCASGGDNTRARTQRAYDHFEACLGHPPVVNVMHGRNRENIYWGQDCFHHPLLRRLAAYFEPQTFHGHDRPSPFFWGDICRARTRYVRMFDTLQSDTLAFDPATPYHDPAKPYVKWWFSSTLASGSRLFRVLAPVSIEHLRRGRGASILHTYLWQYGDASKGETTREFRALVERLAEQSDGWYVPVSILLDRLRGIRCLDLRIEGVTIHVTNTGSDTVGDLALTIPGGIRLWDEERVDLAARRNLFGQIGIGTLPAGATLRLHSDRELRSVLTRAAPDPDEFRLAAGTIRRLAWEYSHGRRGRGFTRSGNAGTREPASTSTAAASWSS